MSDDSANQDFGCKLCWPSSAEAAWEAQGQLTREKTLIDESHYMVAIKACAACSRRFIYVFTETVDWADGEDPMYWTVMPLTQEEVQDLSNGESPSEAALKLLGRDRRSLNCDWPKGADEARAYWSAGISTTRL